MTRAEAVAILKRATGITDPQRLADALQDAGLISDEVIEPKQAATEDLIRAVQKLTNL